MRILVTGATGPTGRLIVQDALARGYSVSALIRSEARATSLAGVDIVKGDARDKTAVSKAVSGCDAVVSSLGTGLSPFREVTTLSVATQILVAEMARGGCRRLVCITGLGAGDSRGHGGFVYDNLILPLLLRNVYADKNRQEAAIRASSLDWVVVRPVMLNDKPARGTVKAVTDLTGIHGGTIARADVARFAVDQVTSDTWLGKTPLISW